MWPIKVCSRRISGRGWPSLRLGWPLFKLCWPILGLCWPILGLCGRILGLCWPILWLCWPILGLCWAHLGAMCAQLATHVGPCGGYVGPASAHFGAYFGPLTHLSLNPQDRKNGKATKHCKLRYICRVGARSAAGGEAPLSYGEERRPTAMPRPWGLGAPGRI